MAADRRFRSAGVSPAFPPVCRQDGCATTLPAQLHGGLYAWRVLPSPSYPRVPLSHRKLSHWYRQLAQQLDAGLPLAGALRSSRGTGVSAFRLETMAARIEAGGSTDDALRTAESWLPQGDLLALSAAAEGGRLPQTLRHLSHRHAELGAAKLKLILACLYPLGVLHLGMLLLPVMQMIDLEKGFRWDPLVYARGLASLVLPLYGTVAIIWILARRGNPVLHRIADMLPAIGGYRRQQALADFAFVLANLLESGVSIGQAWAAAGLITRAPKLKAAAEAMTAVVVSRAAPGQHLHAWPCFPADFIALYQSGESTGQLEANLHRLATQYHDSALRALTVVTLLYPALLFLLVAGTVAYQAIQIYSGYLNMLGKLGA